MGKQEKAISFLNSVRGKYIMGQALFVAIERLGQEKYPETNNINDMTYLLDNLFPLYKTIESAKKEITNG